MKKLICNKTFDKKQITKLIEWFIYNYGTIKTNKLVNKLKFIGFKYSTKAGLSLGADDLKIPLIKNRLIKNTSKFITKKEKVYKSGNITKQDLLQKEIEIWNITNNTLKNEIIKNFRQTDLLNPVYMMIFSGARGNIAQIKQLIGMRGLMADSKGEIINTPIKSSLKQGLKSKEYFISCYGARKGIIDTALKTANSGYLTRKLVYVAQNIIIKQQDCKTKNGILIKTLLNNKEKYFKLKSKLIGNILAENIINKNTKKVISKGQDICPYIAKRIIQNESYTYIRSVLTCGINIGTCQLCYGWNLGNNKLVKIGEAVGILAAQSIGEPGTQLTMRTFHTGGIFTSKTNKVISSPYKGKLIYNENSNGKKLTNKFNERIFFTLKNKELFLKKSDKVVSKIVLPKYSTIYMKSNSDIFKEQVIADITEWKTNKQIKKETKEIKCHNSGQTFQDYQAEKLWIRNGYIIEINTLLNLVKKKKLKLNNLSSNKNYFTNINYKIKHEQSRLIKINYNKSRSFKNKLHYEKNKQEYKLNKIIIEQKKLMIIRKNFKNEVKYKTTNFIKNIKIGTFLSRLKGQIIEVQIKNLTTIKSVPYLIPRNSNVKVFNNDLIKKNTTIYNKQYEKEKTKDIIEGLPKIEEILEAKRMRGQKKIKGNLHQKLELIFNLYSKKYTNKLSNKKTIYKIQRILVNQIQQVYFSQGVDIAEKHIAIIIKQITSKIIIRQKGESNMIEGEILDINKIEIINKALTKKIVYEPILIGISKISLLTESFLSAACFQETIRILSKSAIKGRIDWLTGIKENVILGNLIPAGTGVNNVIINSGV